MIDHISCLRATNGTVKTTRFSEEQMVTLLREADKRSVPEVARKHGVSAQTIDAWGKYFGSLAATGRLKPGTPDPLAADT